MYIDNLKRYILFIAHDCKDGQKKNKLKYLADKKSHFYSNDKTIIIMIIKYLDTIFKIFKIILLGRN